MTPLQLTRLIEDAAADKKAREIVRIDIRQKSSIADYFVIYEGDTDRQVRAIVDEIELKLRQAGATLVRREGEREGRWVLLDYLDIVVHVQHADERAYYMLERIWKDCPLVPLPDAVGEGR